MSEYGRIEGGVYSYIPFYVVDHLTGWLPVGG